MCSLRDSRGCLAALSLTCALPVFDEVRKIALARHMGDILMFQRYFHAEPQVLATERLLQERVPAITLANVEEWLVPPRPLGQESAI